MKGSIKGFVLSVLGSRFAHLLLVLSLCFVLLEFEPLSLKQPQFVACVPTKSEILSMTEVLTSKPFWAVVIGSFYLPSISLTSISTLVVGKVLSFSCVPLARLEIALFLIFSSLQWMLVGYLAERMFKRRRKMPSEIPNPSN